MAHCHGKALGDCCAECLEHRVAKRKTLIALTKLKPEYRQHMQERMKDRALHQPATPRVTCLTKRAWESEVYQWREMLRGYKVKASDVDSNDQ